MSERAQNQPWLLDALGNRFVALAHIPEDPPGAACALCEAQNADGLLVVTTSAHARSISVGLWNRDGSEGEMSGNGARCASLFAQRALIIEPDSDGVMRVRMPAGEVSVRGRADDDDALLAVALGPIRVSQADVAGIEQAWLVDVGNPHVVCLDRGGLDIEHFGKALQALHPETGGINVHLVRVASRVLVQMRTYERGVGVTRACGSGAAAVVDALRAHDFVDDRCEVVQPGGSLRASARVGGFIEIESLVRVLSG